MAVSLRVTGTWAELTADGSVAIPATPQAGDRMYLFARWKDFSITASVANWTELIEFTDGSVNSGNGTGSVKVACWYRDWQSGDTDPTIDFSVSPTNASVVITVMQKTADEVWSTPVARTAAMTNWTTSSQSVSASATVPVPSSGVVLGLIGIRDDTATMTRPATGIDDAAGAVTWNGDYVESPAAHHSTTTGDDGAADLGYRLVSVGATATLRMTGTISASETGAALWVVQGTVIAVTPDTVLLEVSTLTPTTVLAVTPAPAALEVATFSPSLVLAVAPTVASFTITGLTPTPAVLVTPARADFEISTLTPTLTLAVTPATSVLAISTFTPSVWPSLIKWLDPGGDATEAVGHFNVLDQGTVSYDATQQVAGVGSWKFDSDTGAQAFVKVAGVLGAARRVSFYWRYDSVPDETVTVTDLTTGGSVAYSGGGFSNPAEMVFDDNVYATAAPAKNSGQGSVCEFDIFSTGNPAAVIDSVKIIYERKYDVNTSIGISRVKWRIGSEEGPNHDSTDMPLVDTVVTVDVTAERGWTRADFDTGVFEVIAEARRGDSDTSHTQSWDYVKVEVVYHEPVALIRATTSAGAEGFRLAVTPKGAGVVLRLAGGNNTTTSEGYDGITVLLVNTWYRVDLSYTINAIDDMDAKVYVNSVEELAVEGVITDGRGPFNLPDLEYGWVGNPGTDHLAWFNHLYIDDGDDLSDTGNKLSTAKLPASVNQDNWATTGGTGSVSERPLSETNYRQHSASTGTIRQTYTLQTAATGDVDLSAKTIVGYMTWAWAKATFNSGGYIHLVANGVDKIEDGVGVGGGPLTTTPALLYYPETSSTYPSNAAGVGMALINLEDPTNVTLFECGSVVCYEGPDEDDPLFPLQLLQEDTSASVSDTMGGSPPTDYELHNRVAEVPGTIVTQTISSRTADGEVPQQQAIVETRDGGDVGIVVVPPGIEVSVNIDVAGADSAVELRRVDQLVV